MTDLPELRVVRVKRSSKIIQQLTFLNIKGDPSACVILKYDLDEERESRSGRTRLHFDVVPHDINDRARIERMSVNVHNLLVDEHEEVVLAHANQRDYRPFNSDRSSESTLLLSFILDRHDLHSRADLRLLFEEEIEVDCSLQLRFRYVSQRFQGFRGSVVVEVDEDQVREQLLRVRYHVLPQVDA